MVTGAMGLSFHQPPHEETGRYPAAGLMHVDVQAEAQFDLHTYWD